MVVRKLPYPPVKPTHSIKVKIDIGMTQAGAQTFVEETHAGFYNERHKWVQNTEGKKVESSGLAIVFHDICTDAKELTGEIEVNGLVHSIIVGKRLRNPDGTVHHVEMELM